MDFFILPLSFPSTVFFYLYLFVNYGWFHFFNNGSVLSSYNSQKVFSVFVCLLSHFSMQLFFLRFFFLSQIQSGSTLSLYSHLTGCSHAYFLFPCHHFCFLSLGIPILFLFNLFCSSMGSSLLLLVELCILVFL